MVHRFSVVCLMALCLVLTTLGSAMANQAPVPRGVVELNEVIGTVMEVEGTAHVTTFGGVVTPAEIETPIRLHDTVVTGEKARVHILFVDDTEMTLSENTTLRIDEYIFDESDTVDNTSVYSVLRGAFLYVSGLIAKKADPQVTVHTPVGSIGIRGTEFWGGKIMNEYGILVNRGTVLFKTDVGEVTVHQGFGVRARSKRQLPTPATEWPEARVKKAKAMIDLEDLPAVRARVKAFEPRQKLLRLRLRQIRDLKKKEGEYLAPTNGEGTAPGQKGYKKGSKGGVPPSSGMPSESGTTGSGNYEGEMHAQ